MLQKKAAFFLGLVLLTSLAVAPTVLLVQSASADSMEAVPERVAQLPRAQMEVLRIDGSNSMSAINQLLKQSYEQQFPEAEVKLNSSDTQTAIQRLVKDEIDLAAIGRPLTADEKAKGLIEIPISREKIAIIVGEANPFQGDLSAEQVSQIFQGKITNWSEVGGPTAPIRMIDRPEQSDTRLALQRYPLFRSPEFATGANVVRLAQDDTAAVIQALGTDGISYGIASQVNHQDQVRVVKLRVVQEVLPDDALYPYGQVRGYAYKQTPSSSAQAFLSFATAQSGQAAVSAAKLAESKAIATGEKLALPVVQRVQSPSDDAVVGLLPDPNGGGTERSTRWFPWFLGLLPLILLVFLIRWFLQRQTQSAANQTPTRAPNQSPNQSPQPAAPAAPSKPTVVKPTSPFPASIPPSVAAPAEVEAAVTEVDTGVDTVLDTVLDGEWEDPTPEAPGNLPPVPSTVAEVAAPTPTPAVTTPIAEGSEIVEMAPMNSVAPPIAAATETAEVVEVEVIQVEKVESAAPSAPQPIMQVTKMTEIAELAPDAPVAEWIATATEVEVTEILETVAETPADGESGEAEATVPQRMVEVVEGAEVESTQTAEVAADGESGEAGIVAPPQMVEVTTTVALTEPVLTTEPIPIPEPAVEQVDDEGAEVIPEEIDKPAPEVIAEVTPVPEHPVPEQQASEQATPVEVLASFVPVTLPPLNEPTSVDTSTFRQKFLNALQQEGYALETATLPQAYTALASLLCERLLRLNLPETYLSYVDEYPSLRIVGEIAAEYMPGPHLENSLINLGLLGEARQAMQELGFDLKQLIDQEEEPGLGKGGLGRLMSCYLDALSTANVPAIGYGLRYEYGIFDQQIQDGWQVEVSDTWLRNGNPWEVERPEQAVTVEWGGSTESYTDSQERYRVRWIADESWQGIPYDTPIPGYRTATVNLLRLWRDETGEICRVLYPIDQDETGKMQRLKQQFFLVSCALQDALRLHLKFGGEPETLFDRWALQLNDTDLALGIAELMRLLVDEYGVDWELAWEITQRTCSYTNHSLMPESLDDLWTVQQFAEGLPRHLEIIYEINYRCLESVKAQYPDDWDRLNRMSLIDERGDRYIRTNQLACVGSHAVNGVSQLHTELLKQTVLRDFYEMYPQRFSSKTNGITPRRFLLQGNLALSTLISEAIGTNWITNLEELKRLEALAEDPSFRQNWRQVKSGAKQSLAAQIYRQSNVVVNPNSLFDVQAMVMHEYKRQHLNVLHILTLYNRIKANPNLEMTPRTVIFAGKAASDYFAAKLIIKLIHAVAVMVNADPEMRERLKVVFLPDFNIKSAQSIYPSIDLSEHISVAGTEAGDTGNLIAALNGALIIGTPDGTNLELRDAIAAENFFQFGLSIPEIAEQRAQNYNPMESYYANAELRGAIDRLASGELANGDTELFKPLVNLLLYYDRYMLLADYPAYIECQDRVDQIYRDPEQWTRMSILSTARMGQFSSDRAIQAYCQEIWQIMPTPTALLEPIPAKKWVG